MKVTIDLIAENKRLKEEISKYLKDYENLLTEKLILEQEYENYKSSIEELNKIKNQGISGSTTIFDNGKYKSEIDEYLNTIWELQTNLSLKEEENRILLEKNKKLENELNILKENKNENNNNIDVSNNMNISQSGILNIKDLYSSTVIQNIKKKVKKKIKETVNLNVISEDDMEKQKEEEENEIKRKEEEEFERKRKEEEERQKKLVEQEKNKKKLEAKIKEYDDNIKKNLEIQFKEFKRTSNEYYKDIQNQNIYISNYNIFVNELNEEINKLKDKLNIALLGDKGREQKDKISIKIIEFKNSLETISNKNIQLANFIDNSKNIQLKNVENIQEQIQQRINEINNYKKNSNLIIVKNIYEANSNFISYKLNELGKIIESLRANKKAYENSKQSIEEEKNKLKNEITEYVEKVGKSLNVLNQMFNQKEKKGPFIDSIFLRGSMLLGIQDFGKISEIFSSANIFKEDDHDKFRSQDLLRKNWNEVCYVYEDYDIHDVNYELKAVGLPPKTSFTSCSMGFVFDTDVEILTLELDGKKTNYNYQHYSLDFKIHLKNLQSNKVHLKYKESPSKSKMTEGEKRESKFIKNNIYGVSKNVAGENAKFILSIKCDFEVIAFEDEFFIKTNENGKEYAWGGKVPPEGKKTNVKMSKSKGKFNFLYTELVKSRNENPIKYTKMTVPIAFVGGNNEVIKIDCSSEQTDKVTLKQDQRIYEINFLNKKPTIGEFKIQGE